MKSRISIILLTWCILQHSIMKAQSAHTSQSPTKPNIIFIMADDLGWHELGSYGNTFNETPNLDRLASQGVRFTQAYAAAPVCSPTRASLMTGQYPARVGITDFLAPKSRNYLEPEKYVTINEALGQAGYHTGIIGKWHLDTHFQHLQGSPEQHHFDEVIGSETKYIADGDYFFPYDKINTLKEGQEGEFLPDRLAREAVGFIQRNRNNPFFLYLSHYSVHTRLAAPDRLVKKYKRKFDQKYGEGQADKIFAGERHEADHVDNPYLAAMLEEVDTGVGKIMEALERNGLADNTILIFFSDNGGAGRVSNNGKLRAHKTWLYEGGIREPLLVRWPDHVPIDTVIDTPVCSVDFYPTFLEIAAAKNPKNQILDGRSILPLLTKGIKPDREALYWHYPAETGNWTNRMASAVRKGDFKLLQFYEDQRLELYHLKDDPCEKINLADSLPEKTMELRTLLDKWKEEVHAALPARP